MKTKISLALVGVGILALLAYLILGPRTGTVFVNFGIGTFDEMVAQSDVIFVGKVANVSPETWNQDSGRHWSGGLPYRLIKFEVSQYIVDRIELSNKRSTEVLILGSDTLEYANNSKNLMSGAVTVVFAGQTDIVWRENGRKPFLEVTPYSMFPQDDNGNFNISIVTRDKDTISLSEFIARIQAADIQQPPPSH